MRIAFANDHAATDARPAILARLAELGHDVVDFGTASRDPVDYPDPAANASRALSSGRADRAVMVCGSGIGMSIVANRFHGVRCALVTDTWAAAMCRLHNDANALALRAREQDPAVNAAILDLFLETPFEGGRHKRRVEKIEQVSGGEDTAPIPRQVSVSDCDRDMETAPIPRPSHFPER